MIAGVQEALRVEADASVRRTPRSSGPGTCAAAARRAGVHRRVRPTGTRRWRRPGRRRPPPNVRICATAPGARRSIIGRMWRHPTLAWPYQMAASPSRSSSPRTPRRELGEVRWRHRGVLDERERLRVARPEPHVPARCRTCGLPTRRPAPPGRSRASRPRWAASRSATSSRRALVLDDQHRLRVTGERDELGGRGCTVPGVDHRAVEEFDGRRVRREQPRSPPRAPRRRAVGERAPDRGTRAAATRRTVADG